MIKFEIGKKTQKRIDKWLKKEVYPKIIEKQKETMINDQLTKTWWDNSVPYGGAIGGGVTYIFTPTSIGTIIKVKCDDYEKDFTEYDLW